MDRSTQIIRTSWIGIVANILLAGFKAAKGLWWAENGEVDYAKKDGFCFISMIRLPDVVTEKDLQWAISEATRKKKADFSKVEFLRYDDLQI